MIFSILWYIDYLLIQNSLKTRELTCNNVINFHLDAVPVHVYKCTDKCRDPSMTISAALPLCLCPSICLCPHVGMYPPPGSCPSIGISPLLGLLGTASGLVTAFSDFDDKENIRTGIATALSTTIIGIAITVPAVIAQSIFSRKIELFSARLEVLLGRVVSACHQHVFFRDK